MGRHPAGTTPCIVMVTQDGESTTQCIRGIDAELFDRLESVDANRVPFTFERDEGNDSRRAGGPEAAPFPDHVLRDP